MDPAFAGGTASRWVRWSPCRVKDPFHIARNLRLILGFLEGRGRWGCDRWRWLQVSFTPGERIEGNAAPGKKNGVGRRRPGDWWALWFGVGRVR